MNCRTGEITDDERKIAEWMDAGDRVLELPAAPSVLDAIGAKVVDSEYEAEDRRVRAARRFARQVHAGMRR